MVSGKTFYVDGKLTQNCKTTYSAAGRDARGQDGDAYKTIVEAANAARAGDVVLIRAGVYHGAESVAENDVLWPKNSGMPGQPVTFKAYKEEKVVLGEGAPGYPDSESVQLSIAHAVVTLKGVNHISIENLQFRQVDGWVFARNCNHLVFRNCVFQDARHGAKGTAHLVECEDCRFINCSFTNSSFDSLALEKCERTLVEDCTFLAAAHALLAIRSSSHNVVRRCTFNNPYFGKERAEKLVEVYDLKLDRRDPANPAYIAIPTYNSTKHNLFENNFFGYHPFRPGKAAQPSAIQYSGQDGIIRRNIFSNPLRSKADSGNPAALAGGIGFNMRWGGSWEGWKVKTNGTGVWRGEGHEAGYVTHNRVYNNDFYGYDNGCVTTPREDAMTKVLNPPPMEEINPSPQYGQKFAFRDNRFTNNIFSPGAFQAHTNWTWQNSLAGKPVAIVMMGLLDQIVFRRNDFYGVSGDAGTLIYVREMKVGRAEKEFVVEPSSPQLSSRGTFVQSLEKDPQFVDPGAGDFRLKEGSSLVDAGAFLTEVVGSANAGREMVVQDANPFQDGFGIEGVQGDVIQLKGDKETARISHVDYEKRRLTLDRPLSWKDSQAVTLAYAGSGPDIGAFEKGQSINVGAKPSPSLVP